MEVNGLYKDGDYTIDLKDRTEYTGVNPKKFIMWIAMASMTMFFMALASALIIKRGDYQVWEGFKLPFGFAISTLIVVLTSICMQLALNAYKKAQFQRFRLLLTAGFIGGVCFLLQQLNSLHFLTEMGKALTGNISGSFIHMFAYVHGAHIVLLLVITFFFLIFSLRAGRKDDMEKNGKLNPQREFYMELLTAMWHFLGAIWVFLYIFFYLNY